MSIKVYLTAFWSHVSGVAATAYPYLIKDLPHLANFTLSIIISIMLGGIAAALAFAAIQLRAFIAEKS